MEIRISPVKQKISKSAKEVVSFLCKNQPWKGHKEPFRFQIDGEHDKSDFDDLRCLTDISYKYSLKIGTLEAEYGSGSPITSIALEDSKIMLGLVPEWCEFIFVKDMPEFLDGYNAWDDIVSRDPIEGFDDEA